jgi:hypothetical protein
MDRSQTTLGPIQFPQTQTDLSHRERFRRPIGKNPAWKFRTGDGRQRGRRRKGTKNLATDLREELDARVIVTVGGSSKKITRQRAILMRLADNATKGQNPAIAMALDYKQRLVEPLFAKEREAIAEKEK